MTTLSSGVPAQAWRDAAAGRSSIREVCLVGIKTECSARAPGAAAVLEQAVASGSGGRVTWSGRPYSVEATQVLRAGAGGNERFCYVHLSALAEG
jgi:hypothetical protein